MAFVGSVVADEHRGSREINVLGVSAYAVKDFFLGENAQKRVIVKYKDKVTDEDLIDLERRGARVRKSAEKIPVVSAEIRKKDINEIRKNKNVDEVYEDYRVKASLVDSVPQIGADSVHVSGVTGEGVKVCIVDTGIDESHSAINPLVGWKDLVNDELEPYDDYWHGTHVAGIVASQDSLYGGVAPGASLIGVKVLDSSGNGWASDVVIGISECINLGADIISLSLGGGVYSGECDFDPVAYAANIAVDSGLVVVAASGNGGFTDLISSPACGSKVLAVGAVTKGDKKPAYSNGGIELDLVAPGNGIFSTYPSLSGNKFVKKSGTSMATPHVSGTAALLLEANPFLTPAEVGDILKMSAVDLGEIGFDTKYGHGRVDAYSAYQYFLSSLAQSCSVDADCDDGLYCNGVESCSPEGVCVSGEAVQCSDGLFCNGEEICNEATDSCESGNLTIDDGVSCTIDSCDEVNDVVLHSVNNSICDNGLFCDGAEYCDVNLDCQSSALACNDSDSCTLDSCDETLDSCSYEQILECNPGTLCWSGSNEYLIRADGSKALKKFCKCAAGAYGFVGYGRANVGTVGGYSYSDVENNENWGTYLGSDYNPINKVECSSGNFYYTNESYYSGA